MGNTTVTVDDMLEQWAVALRDNAILTLRVQKLEAALADKTEEKPADGN